MATLIESVRDMQGISDRLRREEKRIAFVPTMGFLHEGHASLIRKAKEIADVVVTSVFVNPAQFGAGEDYERYPRDLGRDSAIASAAGTDILFAPSTGALYPPPYRAYVTVELLGDVLEGKSRPGHFRGVATIVTKLLNIVRPRVVLFGQKDAQQVVVIRKLVQDLNYDVEVVVAPTVREADGLALSSRNTYLSDQERKEATVLYRSLQLAEGQIQRGERITEQIRRAMANLISNESRGKIDYISFADSQTLDEVNNLIPGNEVLVSLAVVIGRTRLIDNCLVRVR